MTMRIAILLFLASFASITCWLVCRVPAEPLVAHLPPKPGADDVIVDHANIETVDNEAEAGEVIAISDTEREIRKRLASVVIPVIDVDNVSVQEALHFLTLKLRETEGNELSGLNFVIRRSAIRGNSPIVDSDLDDQIPMDLDETSVILRENGATLAELLNAICEQGGYSWSVEDHVIVLTPNI